MWHVSSRSGVATLRTAIHLLLTYLLTEHFGETFGAPRLLGPTATDPSLRDCRLYVYVKCQRQCQSKIFNVARIAELLRSPRRRSTESHNYVRERLTKKERFKTLTEDGQR